MNYLKYMMVKSACRSPVFSHKKTKNIDLYADLLLCTFGFEWYADKENADQT